MELVLVKEMLGTMVQDQLVEWIRTEIHARSGPAPFFLSVSGGQGVGKSYLTHGLLLKEFPNSIILSLDDYYLRKTDRKALAQNVHPMLRTRGVPGTHDLELLEKHLKLLSTGEPCAFEMPIFDKIADDRSGYEHKQLANIELVIVEGWCLVHGRKQIAILKDRLILLRNRRTKPANGVHM